VPVVLTSRADPREARIASCAIALVVARQAAQAPAGGGLPSPAAQVGARAALRQSATPALQT
jgi:hypothetical protein